ncbi:rnf111-b, partial [Symbiodinium pilosum]
VPRCAEVPTAAAEEPGESPQSDEESHVECAPDRDEAAAEDHSKEELPQQEEPAEPVERTFGLRTLLEALQASERVNTQSIEGPFQLNQSEEVPLVCFQFKMSHFVCKAFLAAGSDEGTRHLKLQTIFEDNRHGLIEEHRYFMANEWNTSKPYTRLKCGSSDRGRTNVFTLEYDLLCPVALKHSAGVLLLNLILRMWYTSMVACVMHIVAPRDLPFATHSMIVENTLTVAVREEDVGMQKEACPICLECFQVGDKVRRLPCMHLFHVVGGESSSSQGRHCNIDRHLVLDKQCPVCKTPIDIMEKMEREQGQAAAPATAPATVNDESQDAGGGPASPVEEPQTQAPEAPQPTAGQESTDEATIARPLEPALSPERLPEQAAELERVVRSLQSRWLQIQDVVAGVQQMLHYIEDSQTALTAARTGANNTGQDTTQTAAQEAAPTVESEAATVDAPARPVAVATAIPEGPALAPSASPPEEVQVELQFEVQVEVGQAEPANEATRETEPVETGAPLAPTASAAHSGQVTAAPTAPTPGPTPEQEPCPTQEGAPAPWQPFTYTEKVCSAYAWRRRRLSILQAASSGSPSNV